MTIPARGSIVSLRRPADVTGCTPSADGLVHGLVDSVDCHIRTLAHDSYRDLVGPGTPFAAAFTAMLTIYIALIGYQLLLGRGALRLTSLPIMALKIGLIMAFVTSWASYQTVIFSLLFEGPRDILAALLRTLRASGFDGDVYDGIEGAYRVLSHAAATYGAQASPAANILQGGPMLGAGLLWLCAIALLLVTVGVILAAKIVLGFLLAIGPVFVAFLLFDRTRGLFDGWLRAAIGFAIAPLAANVFGAAMLVMLAPFLATISDNADAGVFDMSPIITVGLIVAVFALVMGMALRAGATIAGGFSTQGGAVTRNVGRNPTETAPAAALEFTGAPAPGDRATPDTERSDSMLRRTQIVREPAEADHGDVFERLGQAYRRQPRLAVRAAGDAQ